MPQSHSAPPTLAEKLDRLFQTFHPRGRGEYSYREVAAGIREQGGPPISATYLWELRTGLVKDPRKSHLEAIARFFEVPPAYFFDDDVARAIAAELDLLRALRDSQVRHLALRAADLSPESLAAIAAMVEHARDLEGLSDRGTTRPLHRGRKPDQQRAHARPTSHEDQPSTSSEVPIDEA